jgi:RND family efflux transporter MFP subunit
MKPAVFFSFKRQLSARSTHRSQWFYPLMLVSALISPGVVNAEEFDATLLWGNKTPLGTPVSGVVTAVNVAVGDFVKKDSVLLTLDSRMQQADVLAHKAAVKQSENDRDEAGRELERTQELYDRTLISDHDLEVAVIQRDAAEAKYQMAKALLLKAELDLEYATVKAPFDAWIVGRDVAVGQTIVSRLQATPLLELVEAGFMLARTSVPAKKISSFHKRKKATITVAGKQYSGQVLHVALEPTKPGSGEYSVDVMFNSGKAVLRAGLPAKVSF